MRFVWCYSFALLFCQPLVCSLLYCSRKQLDGFRGEGFRGHTRTSSMPHQDVETGQASTQRDSWWQEKIVSMSSMKESLSSLSASSMKESIGTSASSFKNLVTQSASDLLQKMKDRNSPSDNGVSTINEDLTQETAAVEERESLTPTKPQEAKHGRNISTSNIENRQRGPRTNPAAFLSSGLDNSLFARTMMTDYDEDGVDPMDGWNQRNEKAGPPEIVQIALPEGEIPGGPTKITLSCADGDSLSEFIHKACQKIDSMQPGGVSTADSTSAVSRVHQYSLIDILGCEFHDESVIGNLYSQLRSFKKEEDIMVSAKLKRNDGRRSEGEELPGSQSRRSPYTSPPRSEGKHSSSSSSKKKTRKSRKKRSPVRETEQTPQETRPVSKLTHDSPEVLAAIDAATAAVEAASQVAQETYRSNASTGKKKGRRKKKNKRQNDPARSDLGKALAQAAD